MLHFTARPGMLFSMPSYNPFLNIVKYAWSAYKIVFKAQLAESRVQILDMPFQEKFATLIHLVEQNLHDITLPKIEEWYREP